MHANEDGFLLHVDHAEIPLEMRELRTYIIMYSMYVLMPCVVHFL